MTIVSSALFPMSGMAVADQVTSGTATAVGEPSNPKEGAGRAKIRVCGTVSASVADLRSCTFQLNDLGFVVNSGDIFAQLAASRGGKANDVSFQSDQGARPTLKAQVKTRTSDTLEFCVTVDRAVIDPAPSGISIQPCVDGETADVPLSFDLDCADGPIAFSETATWRVPATTCPIDFPSMRTP
jgi:hypothetical protein